MRWKSSPSQRAGRGSVNRLCSWGGGRFAQNPVYDVTLLCDLQHPLHGQCVLKSEGTAEISELIKRSV